MCPERELHRCMQSDEARVLAGKRVLLLGDLMRESGFPDADEITNKIASGFDVVGALSPSGAFSPQPRTEASSVGALWRGSKAMQRTVIDSMRPDNNDALDAAVTTITEDEVANGWLSGPWTEEQLSDKLGLWIPVPRFGSNKETPSELWMTTRFRARTARRPSQRKSTQGASMWFSGRQMIADARCFRNLAATSTSNSPQESWPARASTMTGQGRVWKSLVESGT